MHVIYLLYSQNKLIERAEILSHFIEQRLSILYFCEIFLGFDICLKTLEIILKNFGNSECHKKSAIKKCHRKNYHRKKNYHKKYITIML
jgi:hypothetical protein